MLDSMEASDEAKAAAQFLVDHPETFKLVTDAARQGPAGRGPPSPINPNGNIRLYARIVKLIAETTIDSTELVLPYSTKDRFVLIYHLQKGLPVEKPLPLIWPTKHPEGSDLVTMADSTSETGILGREEEDHRDGDGSRNEDAREDWSSDVELENPTPEFISRLAVTRELELVYAPGLIRRNPVSSGSLATPWSYGTLYLVHYPEDNIEGNAAATKADQLARSHVSLPRVVLDLGRLVVTSDVEDRSDGRSWSPSDFTVMVDMRSETKAVWLVCDSKVANSLGSLNDLDGMADDLESVHSCFDSKKMDLALLFPNIHDWASSENSWLVIEDRISQSAMKLGLFLSHL